MGKRRRERDRPKAGPNDLYNPNKRVQLTYGDEDESEADSSGLPEQPPLNLPAAAKLDSPASAAQPSDARDSEANTSEPTSKRPSRDPGRKPNAKPGRNSATNQKPALGSLAYQFEDNDDDDDDGAEYPSEEDEAMAYLKAVRSERQGMPAVLRVAEERGGRDPDYEVGDSRGFYVEDCYIARPALGPSAPVKTTVTPREAYTRVLGRRFEAMRERLRGPPPASVEESGQEGSRPFLNPNGGREACTECVSIVKSSSPSLDQLYALSQEDTLSTLELIQKHFFKRGETLSNHVSAWIWALLAKLDVVGTMNNDEVFVLRDLGKRALVIQISFSDAAMAAQLEELARAEAGSESDESASPASEEPQTAASGETDSAGSPAMPKQDPENTLATLDMIITIVGEFYGQRDLLDSRRSWDPEE